MIVFSGMNFISIPIALYNLYSYINAYDIYTGVRSEV